MIELNGAGRSYGHGRSAVAALREVTHIIPSGEVTAVVGPNGAGKSTLFALVLGFIAPTAGRVTIAGADPRAWVRRHGAGYLPERFQLPRDWPVGKALAALARLESGDADGCVGASLERWGLADSVDRAAGVLSRGTLQRVGLAQATLVPHELVILDEPSEGLDPIWRIRLRDEIAALRAAGSTVLLASHDLAEVARVADRVVLLDAGRIIDTISQAVPEDGGREWRLTLAEPFQAVGAAFPGARALDGASEFIVTAKDEHDLSARVAALLAQGALLATLVPESDALESRVRRALEPPDA